MPISFPLCRLTLSPTSPKKSRGVTYNPLSYFHLYTIVYVVCVRASQIKIMKGLPNDDTKALWAFFKKIREQKQISQEKFALSINMDRTYYASVEAGNRNISLNNIHKIALGFDMSLSELFAEVENEMSDNK